MVLRILASISIGASLFSPTLSSSQEWPRFLGENGNGIGQITSMPDSFTSAKYDWAIKLKGEGHSSPVLWGTDLFLTISDRKEKQRRVECYDGETGKKKWQWSTPFQKHHLHDHNNFASSTPAVNDEGVFLVWGDGTETHAIGLNLEGELLWQEKWEGFSSDHGFGASPVFSSGVLILHTDCVDQKRSFVRGLDPATGEELWSLERITIDPEAKHLTSYSTPVSVEIGGEEIVVVLQTNDGWRGIAPQTGETIWHYPGDYSLRSVGSLSAHNGMLFATFGSGMAGKHATALLPREGKAPKVVYELGISDGLSYVPTPIIYKDRLYLWGDGGVLTCRDLKTGQLIYRERVGGNYFSSPIIADEKIWCGSRDGEFVSVRVGDEFEILGRSRLGSGMHATPAVANNRLFIRTHTHLICIKGR